MSGLSDGMICVCRPEFYAVFWSMSLYDIHVPKERYEVSFLFSLRGDTPLSLENNSRRL